jgi:5'-3' exonuclease
MTRLLVDGNGVACRCWWASASNVVERFKAAVERAKPSDGATVVVCWDGPGSWRRDLYPAYKANRGPKPQALVKALEECRSAFPGYVAHGFEADDLLATFARAANGDVTLILSDDKDLLQLVTPSCLDPDFKRLVLDSHGKVYDRAAVIEKFGVPPERIRHLLSWTGDKVDGLPGVPGYGPKRAIARALAGEIGNEMTYELTQLADVPAALVRGVSLPPMRNE